MQISRIKKLLFILTTLCLCSGGFSQSNSKNNEVGYKEDLLNEGASEPFVSGLLDWRKFRNYEESGGENETTTPPSNTTIPPPTTTTTPPSNTTIPPPTTTTTPPSNTTIPPPTTTTTPPSNPTTTPPPTTTTTPPSNTTTTPPPTTTPKGNGAIALSCSSFSTFGILLLVHSICKYKYT